MPIYLKLGDIKGSVTDAKFKEQIQLSNFSWGADLAVSNRSSVSRTEGRASVSAIQADKLVDKSSEHLFKSLLLGKSIDKGVISFTASSNGFNVAFATLTIENVIVSRYTMAGDGENNPYETVHLNFTKFDWSYIGRDAKQTGSPTHLIFDIAAAT